MHMDFYTVDELTMIVTRAAGILRVGIDADGAREVADARAARPGLPGACCGACGISHRQGRPDRRLGGGFGLADWPSAIAAWTASIAGTWPALPRCMAAAVGVETLRLRCRTSATLKKWSNRSFSRAWCSGPREADADGSGLKYVGLPVPNAVRDQLDLLATEGGGDGGD